MVLLPASTGAGALAPPSFLAPYHLPVQAGAAPRRSGAQGAAHAGRLHARQPGGVAGRIRGARRADRPVPDGRPVPYRVDLFGDEVDSIRTFDPDTQRSLYPVPEGAPAAGREFPMDEARAALFARAGARSSKATRPSRIYKDIGQRHRHRRHRVLPAAVLRGQTATIFDYLGEGGDAGAARRGRPRLSASGPTRERHRFLRTTERPSCRPEEMFLRSESSSRQPHASDAGAELPGGGDAGQKWARRCRPPGVEPARPSRWRACKHLQPRRTACSSWPRARAGARACSSCCATTADRARQRRHAGRPFQATEQKPSAAAPLAEGFFWHWPQGVDQFVTETGAVRHRAVTRAAQRARSRSATSTR